MAVDIKTLRIGNHVEYEGNRVRICSLKTNMANYDDGKGKPRCFGSNLAYYKRMQPIPITSDLLTELGFKWRKDSACWRKYQNYDGEKYDWGIYAYECEGGTWCFSLYLPNFLIKPQLYAGHLHELEGQLAYYGVELIKERVCQD